MPCEVAMSGFVLACRKWAGVQKRPLWGRHISPNTDAEPWVING